MEHTHGHNHGYTSGHAYTPPHNHGFARRAASYDETAGSVSQPFYRLLVETVTLPDGAALLDVACGTGALLQLLTARRGTGHIDAHGIDAEETMVQVAKEKCPELDIRVALCDAAPYPDGHFDALTTCLAYHHFPDGAAFAREALRLLKPGGKLYIAEPCALLPEHTPARAPAPQNAAPAHAGPAAPIPKEELFVFFARHGFLPAGSTAHGTAQVVILEKPA